jgi:hypothetical protein
VKPQLEQTMRQWRYSVSPPHTQHTRSAAVVPAGKLPPGVGGGTGWLLAAAGLFVALRFASSRSWRTLPHNLREEKEGYR